MRSLGWRAAAVTPAALAVLLPSAAFGGETSIDHVSVSQQDQVSVVLSVDGLPAGVEPDLDTLEVTVEGTPVDATAKPIKAGDIKRTTVLALDASLSMEGERFAAAKSAARAFVETAPDDVAIGLITFSGSVDTVTTPTTAHQIVLAAIDGIELDRQTLVYDAVVEATSVAGEEGARTVLLLSDGEDTGSSANIQDAAAAVVDSGVVVDVVAVQQSAESIERLALIAEASGGQVVDAQSTRSLETLFRAQANALAGQLLVSFPKPAATASEASISVAVSAGGLEYEDSAFVPLTTTTAADSHPESVELRAALVGDLGLWIGALALAIGLGGLLSFALLRSAGSSAVQRQIGFYSADGSTPAVPGSRKAVKAQGPTVRETAVATAQKLVKGDFETRLAQRLNGAGLAMTAAEWLLTHAGIAVAASFVGLILRGPAMAVLLLLMGAFGPWMFLKVKHSRRLAAFNGQLAETLQLIAGGLSAGLSLPQAVDTVVREGVEPMSGELRRALTEQRLGIDIEEALDGVAGRMDSQDFAWVVMAIRIQREVGGNLAELLNTVSDTLRERDYLRRQVKVLSAEGRFSAWILGGMPIAMFMFLLMVRPHAVRPLFTEPMGILMSGVAIVLLLMGFFVMSKLVKVEV